MPQDQNFVDVKKLHHSKWTAVTPIERQKHFMVVQVIVPEDGSPIRQVVIEAVLTRQQKTIEWRSLKSREHWRSGWS
ncbi:MAG: TIGR02450 family Trp-rich protein [Burkholderiaceae bacterium]|nr:TIGR02450 family Trp-rich protein [Burkholderiaceae bacterium]